MHELAPLINDLAIMLGLAGIVVVLFQRIHQPVVLGYLVAGMIVGPHTPPHALVNDISNIQILSELGVIFLMFSLGLEFSFQKLTRVGFSASFTGLFEVLFMLAIGYGAGCLLGWSQFDSLFLGAALSISSTTIIIKAIDELGLKTKRFAELIFGVLIVEDLLAVLLLVALSTIVVTKNIFSFGMVSASVKLILVVGGWFLFGYFLVPPLFRKIARYISQETLTIISVALCLSLVSVAAKFHYSSALGAFIMGSILAETVLVKRIEELIQPIRDIFAAVFFISVGMLIDPAVIIQNWPVVIFISVVTILGKIITTSLAAFLTGQSLNTSVRVGFSMAQIGEFSFIIVAMGVSLQVTGDKLYPLVVAVSGITTFTTPYLIRLSGQITNALSQHLPARIHYFMESYSAWVYRTQTTTQRNSLLGTVTIRVIVNGMIVAIIFSIIHYAGYRDLSLSAQSNNSNIILLILSLILSSPFIWGMLFAYRKANLPEYAKVTLNPVVFMVWLLTLTEISMLEIIYFHTWITTIVFIVIAIGFFIVAYKHLERSYHWFEAQLIRNLKVQNAQEKIRYEELAPWDTHLLEIEVGDKSPFIGKTLGECRIRQDYGVNIVAISHGSRVIPAPRGDEKIFSHDKLIVLGNDSQIDRFKAQVEILASESEAVSFLDNFILKSILVRENQPINGQSIRHSQIREKINGMVVGLERGGVRILNPDPDTILQADDLLLLVGETEKLQHLTWV